jgi:hypothetical protein
MEGRAGRGGDKERKRKNADILALIAVIDQEKEN